MKEQADAQDPEHRPRAAPARSEDMMADAPATTRRAPSARPLTVAAVQRLQSGVGNRALSGMLAQRTTTPAPTSEHSPVPEPVVPTRSHDDARATETTTTAQRLPPSDPNALPIRAKRKREDKDGEATDPNTPEPTKAPKKPTRAQKRLKSRLVSDAFPYAIQDPRVSLKVDQVGSPKKNLEPFPGNDSWLAHEDSTGFVVNLPAMPEQAKSDLASRYLDEGWAGGAVPKDLAAERTAVVAGVNAFERLDSKETANARKEIAGAMGRVASRDQMRMAVFGFLWQPRWVDKDGKDVPLEDVRKEYEALKNPADRALADNAESNMRQNKTLPYGALREQVLRSEHTRKAVEILSARNRRVHIFSQDPDGELKTIGTNPMCVLAKYTDLLAAMDKHPMLTIGGYSFEGFEWDDKADSRTQELTRLANQIDRAIRVAVSEKMPRMVYPTEPNLLIKAWTHDQREHPGIFQDPAMTGRSASFWGADQAEGWAARKRLSAGYKGKEEDFVRYAPEASTTTDPVPGNPSRKFTLGPETVKEATRPRLRDKHPADAILAQSQTYASANRLAMEMAVGSGGVQFPTQKNLEKIYAETRGIIRAMVDKPTGLNSEELAGRLAAVDKQVADALKREEDRKDLVEKAGEITKHIIEALTAGDLAKTWSELAAVLKQMMDGNPSGK